MKGIYVPPGRRQQNGGTAAPSSAAVVSNSSANSVPDVSESVPSTAASSTSASAPAKLSTRQGVYIPPGRREAEEKRAALEEERRLAQEQRAAEERQRVEVQQQAEELRKRDVTSRPAASAGALYVPKGRRELNEKRLADSQSTSEDHPKRVAGTLFDRIEANSKPAASIPHVPSSSSVNSVDSTAFNTYIPSDFDLACSTVIVRGFPTNYSFLARDSFATQYSDKGAMVRWLANDQELLVVFKNEMTCLSELHSSTSYAFTITRLCDQTDCRDEYLRGM